MKEKFQLIFQKLKSWVLAHKKLAAIFLIVIIIVGLGARRFVGSDQQAEFITSSVERVTITDSVQASGNVISTGQQTIITQANGIVSQVFVKDGDTVAKGDKLVEFELDQEGEAARAKAWSTYLSSKNAVNSQKATQYSLQADMFGAWDEFKNLAESGAYENDDGTPRYDQRSAPEFHIPEKDWLAAEAKYKNQAAEIAQAQAAFSSSWLSFQMVSPTITAPTSGVVKDLTVAEGMVVNLQRGEGGVSSSHKLLSLVTGEQALVSVAISEVDVNKVETDQKVIITVDAITDKSFTGRISGIDRTGSVSQGVVTYSALISLDTADKDLLPNMSVTAEIILSSKSGVLTIPVAAVSQSQGKTVVRVLVNGKAEEKEIEVGLSTPTQVEILSGLEEGELVITGQRQAGDQPSQFGGQSRGGFGGGALRPGGFGGGRSGSSGGGFGPPH